MQFFFVVNNNAGQNHENVYMTYETTEDTCTADGMMGTTNVQLV